MVSELNNTGGNSTYKKLAVQWLNEACAASAVRFVVSSVLYRRFDSKYAY